MRRKFYLEILAILIALYFFQDGLYKIVYWTRYGAWLRQAPFVHSAAGAGKYAVTGFELAIAFGMFFQRFRVMLSCAAIFGLFLAMMLILAGCLFSRHLFFPFHLLWIGHANWFDVLLVDLLLAWLGLAILWMEVKARDGRIFKLSH